MGSETDGAGDYRFGSNLCLHICLEGDGQFQERVCGKYKPFKGLSFPGLIIVVVITVATSTDPKGVFSP
jgi:hypothetical protein